MEIERREEGGETRKRMEEELKDRVILRGRWNYNEKH
jgi:hypothetical protein